MVALIGGEALRRGGFRLAGWLVQPSLNRISHGGSVVQLEPKMIDVLVVLAENAGAVVAKETLIDTVWKKQFISEWVLTRAIAKLRSAFGDDARNPRMIETISKRGYRLLIAPEGAEPDELASPCPPARVEDAARPSDPSEFLGRAAQLDEILHGPRRAIWLLGTRGIGKTSLLRHLERLTSAGGKPAYFPLYWDMQGAAGPAELHRDFSEAVLDARGRLEATGIAVADVLDDDLFVALGRLRRRLAAAGTTLLLLCDEAEELIQLRAQDPALLRKLRRALQSGEAIRSVLAASPRLWALASGGEDTSPFLHGFAPPVYLGPLTDREADTLARAIIGSGAPEALDEIRTLTGNHPFMLALVCGRLRAHGDLRRAAEETATEPALEFLFATDVETLAEDERQVLRLVAASESGGTVAAAGDAERSLAPGALYRLEQLGMVRARADGSAVVASSLFSTWLRRR